MAMSRSRGGMSLTTRSSILISPPVTVSSPAIIRRIVLLPQPDGPTRTRNSPSTISKSTPCTTSRSPYFLTRRLTTTCAISVPSARSASHDTPTVQLERRESEVGRPERILEQVDLLGNPPSPWQGDARQAARARRLVRSEDERAARLRRLEAAQPKLKPIHLDRSPNRRGRGFHRHGEKRPVE